MVKPIPDTFETRTCLVASDDGEIEVRAAAPTTGEQPGFDGYIALWNVVDDRGTFFVPGSFKKTLRERAKSAPILWNHDYYNGVPIGKHVAAVEDERGVRITAAINEGVQRGAEVMSNLRFGTPTGLSFGFDRMGDRTATDKDEIDLSVAPEYIKSLPRNEIRAVTEVRYWEASPVTFASNSKAKPDRVRSMDTETLSTLLDALKDGTLDVERRAVLEQIVAAWNESAAAGNDHGTPEARHAITFDYELLMLELGEAA